MRCVFLIVLLLCPVLGTGCSTDGPLRRFQYSQVVMGVRADIAAYAETEEKARIAAQAAFSAMNDLDGVLSDYRADSEAMRLCSRPPLVPVPVSRDLSDALSRSLEFSRASHGAFDVTVGPLVQLWRAARRERVLPDETALRAALAHVGWEKVVLGRDPSGAPTVTLLVEGMRLDFGGIGKGYAADRALRVLGEHGLRRCLVAVAGDIAIGEPPPGAPGWRVELNAGGDAAPTGPRRFVVLARCGISTSGDTEQFVEIDGHRYSHIVDPRTGRALEDWQADTLATVVAPDATASDVLCKVVCVMTAAEGLEILKSFPGCAAFIRSRTGGRDYCTEGFPELMVLRE